MMHKALMVPLLSGRNQRSNNQENILWQHIECLAFVSVPRHDSKAVEVMIY